MSGWDTTFASKAEDFLSLFKKGAEFSRELMEENERLRGLLAEITDRQESAARNPADWGKLRDELMERIASLEEECTTVRERLDQAEIENSHFAQRYVEVEEENNNLANLYVSSYQLHSTLDLDEVVKVIMEIVINLIGADVFAIYLLEGEDSQLAPVASEGREVAEFPTATLGQGPLGKAALEHESTCWDDDHSNDLSQPILCVPLVVQGRSIGAISIYRLLSQKDGFSALDHELFNVLGGHAATAIFAAKLYSQSERKLNTIQGFIELLSK
jgi:hypothetical protein